MQFIVNPAVDEWDKLCYRNCEDDLSIDQKVTEIIEAVRRDGDAALKNYARKFDKVTDDTIVIGKDEIKEARKNVRQEVKDAIGIAIHNIEKFHEAQKSQVIDINTQPGVRCVQKSVPIQRPGLYIPGGRAPLFSTVLMLALPARIAGCKETVLCTPRSGDFGIAPEILYAASECGVSEMYATGGAQAIAAMAYGTQTIKPVHKIFGPGNRYVTKAKQLVSTRVAIDMPAGPSEVLVMADNSCNPQFVASDLLSQAEHGPDSQAMLVCTDITLAHNVLNEIEELCKRLPRMDSISKSLEHSRIIILPELEKAIEFVNLYAPEHLIISMEHPWDIADKITAAGSVFIGNFSPESAGDYASGTNHTLPTSGWATAFSGVNLDSFNRKITYQELTKEGISELAPVISTMARAEGLEAHAIAAEIRTKNS